MDRYDAIREQLRATRSRGVDTLRDRLNQVLEAVEQLKSSVREALDRPADEVFPLHDIEAAITVLEEEPPAPVAAPPAGLTLDAIRRLDAARTQSDLLHELMTILSEHATRTVVLVLRDNVVSAWSGVGFLDASALEKWQGVVSDSPLLKSFAAEPRPIRFNPGRDPVVGKWLSDLAPAEDAILVPVSLRGKLMGAFYADSAAGDPWSPDIVQTVVAVGCWLIDTLHHRSVVPSPMLAELTEAFEPDAEGARVPVAAAQDEAEVVEEIAGDDRESEPIDEVVDYETRFEAAEEPEVEEAEEFAPAEVAAEEAVEFEVAEVEEAPDLIEDSTFDPSATVQVDLDEIAEHAEPEPPAAGFGVDAELADEAPPVVEPPRVQPVVPPDEVPAEGPVEGAPLTPDEETRHEEARRFARLLVSEIKLYNEEEVDQGRASRNLYQRLREDIDRSREMYEKRISPDIRAARDYFHEELVRILADGDAGALGM